MIVKLILIVVLLFIFYLLSIAPNRKREDIMKPFEKQYIAHRGLFDNSGDCPENSLPAFQRAVEYGYGIELDVQTTADGMLVVFHDESLRRMCGINKRLYQCSYEELMQYRLAGSEEGIPLLKDVLKIIGGKVPLIAEIKTEGNWKRTAELTAEMLNKYKGCYCIESFNPLIVGYFRKKCPETARGQLSTNYFRDRIKRPVILKLLLTNLMFNFISRPDFIAYNHKWSNQLSYRICRNLYSVKNAAWTIRNKSELESAGKIFDIIIFDSFIP